jgi:hypothetical protein
MAHSTALQKQNHSEKSKRITEILDEAAVKIEPEKIEPEGFTHIEKLYRSDMQDIQKAVDIVKSTENGAELAYRKDDDGAIHVYQKGGFAGELTETEIKERTKKQETDERRFRLKKLLDQAYELRIKHVKSHTVTAETRKIIESEAVKILFTGTERPFSFIVCELLEIKGPLEKEDISAIIKKHNNDTMLLRAVYARLEPGIDPRDYTGNRIGKVYWFLECLGYILSDEEIQISNGTHPLIGDE